MNFSMVNSFEIKLKKNKLVNEFVVRWYFVMVYVILHDLYYIL
jgi:hypothetical protein